MKRIVLITAAAALFAPNHFCLAQKTEPPTEPHRRTCAAPGIAQSTRPRSGAPRLRRVGVPAGGYGGGATVFSNSKGDSIPPVMIRFSQPDAKTSAGLEEDLFVMARVISRTLDRADAENGKVLTKMGVPMLLTGQRTFRAPDVYRRDGAALHDQSELPSAAAAENGRGGNS